MKKTDEPIEQHAFAYAERFAIIAINLLQSFCDKIEITGAMRRERNEVPEIELLVIPKTVSLKVDLFTSQDVIHPGFVDLLKSEAWKFISGDPSKRSAPHRTLLRRYIPGNILIRIYIVSKEDWGVQQAMKTGPFTFRQIVGQKCSRKRWMIQNGRVLVKKTKTMPRAFETEEEFLEALNITWTHPRERWTLKPQDNSKWIKKPSTSGSSN